MKVQQQFVMCANANAPSLPLSLSPSLPLRFEVEVARARRAPYLASQDEREREENSKLLARSFEAGFLAILAAKKRKRKRADDDDDDDDDDSVECREKESVFAALLPLSA